MRKNIVMRYISRSAVREMRIRGKLRCPYCDKTLIFVHESLRGQTTRKCDKCEKESYVDLDKMEVRQIVDVVPAS